MQACFASDPENRYFARLALAALPRGGGDGDAIRMGILHIMRENGIREGHRPASTFAESANDDTQLPFRAMAPVNRILQSSTASAAVHERDPEKNV